MYGLETKMLRRIARGSLTTGRWDASPPSIQLHPAHFIEEFMREMTPPAEDMSGITSNLSLAVV